MRTRERSRTWWARCCSIDGPKAGSEGPRTRSDATPTASRPRGCLLQIRSLADDAPDQLAQQVIPRHWVQVLAKIRKRSAEEMTIEQFVRHLAGLGGHLGRKRDGRPGWITVWRGLEKLLLILRGASIKP